MEIEDTYAEAFEGYYSRILVTAKSRKWLMHTVNSATAYATSCIGCGCEAGVEGIVEKTKTPDKRLGALVQFWVPAWGKDAVKKLEHEVMNRIGQCVLTAPTTAVWNATQSKEKLPVGKKLGFFGDGHQVERKLYDRNVVIIPRMMGDFIVEKEIGYGTGIMGGNLWFFCESEDAALKVSERAVEAISDVEGVITTFPGGVCASGSKVGSRYDFLYASTNHLFCPSLKCKISDTRVPANVESISEVIINGINEKLVKKAMRSGINAVKNMPGLVKVSAANFGGKLGKYKIHLR